MNDSAAKPWDVIVIGGALAGSATAILLRRRNPRLRVLIMERTTEHRRRVGESTVEISAYFLSRVLGFNQHLVEHHLPKQGLRFWFNNDRARSLDQCSETGPRYNVRLPGFQIDRAVLDQHALNVAVTEGAQLLRPVRVREVKLDPEGGTQSVEWQDAGGERHVDTARWVVDASGVAALVARQEGWHRTHSDHPIATCWSRWQGVTSLDDRALAARYPSWASRVFGQRAAATNHLVGYGWWAWIIPLKGGDVSIGFVYDQRITELPPGPSMGERLRAMLNTHPVARELLASATWQEGDVHFRRHLAYTNTTHATPGAVLVGDAAGFIDPFYSPGLDWLAFSVCAATALIEPGVRSAPLADRVAEHNRLFTLSYHRWFNALYRDKYFYIGDFELMTLAFGLDLGLYYLGVVKHAFAHGQRLLEAPPFTHPHATWPYRLMVLYNRRFAAMGRARHERGTWGRYNDRKLHAFTSYEFNRRLPLRVAGLVGRWLKLELTEGWRSWLSPAPQPLALDHKPAPV